MLLDELEERYAEELSKLVFKTQEDGILWIDESEKHIHAWQGPVGSGKTFMAGAECAQWVYLTDFSDVFPDERVLLAMGKTQSQVNKLAHQVFKKIYQMCDMYVDDKMFGKDVWYLHNKHHGFITVRPFVYGEKGADAKADSILGDNYVGFIIEEANNLNRKVIEELPRRMGRIYGPWRGWMVSNPEGPDDYYQAHFLDNPETDWMLDYHTLGIRENPNIPDLEDFVKVQYSTSPAPEDVMKYILGIPATPGNLAMPGYRDYFHNREDERDITFVGIDFGKVNITACVEIGYNGEDFHAMSEFIIDGNKGGPKIPREQAELILERYPNAAFFAVDQTADGLISALSTFGEAPALESFMPRRESNKLFKRMCQLGLLTIGDCPTLKREMSQWHYDRRQLEKAQTGELKEVRINDHVIDGCKYAMEYAIEKFRIRDSDMILSAPGGLE